MPHTCRFTAALVAVLTCAATLTVPVVAWYQSAGAATAATQAQAPATLYVFNLSGKTLISGSQRVEDAGSTLVKLPRRTYQKVSIAPGAHELTLPNLRKPVLHLDVEPGRTYYVVVAYRPERSYGWPLTDSPMVLHALTEDEAQPLFSETREVEAR